MFDHQIAQRLTLHERTRLQPVAVSDHRHAMPLREGITVRSKCVLKRFRNEPRCHVSVEIERAHTKRRCHRYITVGTEGEELVTCGTIAREQGIPEAPQPAAQARATRPVLCNAMRKRLVALDTMTRSGHTVAIHRDLSDVDQSVDGCLVEVTPLDCAVYERTARLARAHTRQQTIVAIGHDNPIAKNRQ